MVSTRVGDQHETALADWHNMNSANDNSLCLLLGRHQPDHVNCTFLRELQKEKADIQVSFAKLSFAKEVKISTKKKGLEQQTLIWSIAMEYDYKVEDRILDYHEPSGTVDLNSNALAFGKLGGNDLGTLLVFWQQ